MIVAVVDVSSVEDEDEDDGVRRCKGCRSHAIAEKTAGLGLWMNAMHIS